MPERQLRIPVLFSILAALFTLALKYLAYHVTGSVGLLSDAAESIVNVLAAVTAFVSLWYASKPVDVSHTYGHEKIEFFSSGLEGIFILFAGGAIIWYAVRRLYAPEQLQALDLGIAVALIATLVNLIVARLLLRVGRMKRSIVLEAGGKHLMTDVWTSVGVVASMALVSLTGVQAVDPIIALIVALKILWTGFDLVRISFNGLMDHALSPSEQEAVRAAVQANLEPGMDYHALRTRQAGSRRFADFHLLVPGALTVQQAHNVTNRIEDAVQAALPGIEVTVHVEPIEEQAAWQDSALLPIERAARQTHADKPGGETPQAKGSS
jgi:cation diffusion facilitator family transporter